MIQQKQSITEVTYTALLLSAPAAPSHRWSAGWRCLRQKFNLHSPQSTGITSFTRQFLA